MTRFYAKIFFSLIVTALIVGSVRISNRAAHATEKPILKISTPAPLATVKLTDITGKPWSLLDDTATATVVVMIATECPMANGYQPILAKLYQTFSPKGVRFVGVNPNADEPATAVAAHAKEYAIAFPIIHDTKHELVSALTTTTTPEVVVLDGKGVVQYRGRIDDQYAGRMKAKATTGRADLEIAIGELLAGKPISVPSTKAFGCPIAPLPTVGAANEKITFYREIAPIVQKHCQGCHRPDQVAPFSLMTYSQVSKWGQTCLEEIQSGKMPPWKPEANALLSGNRSLPAAARATWERWVAQGMPEGNAADAPPPVVFASGWTLGEPDLVLEAPSAVTIDAHGRDHFRVQSFPTNLPTDMQIVAMEVKPGNPRVVHHTLQLIDAAGKARKLQAEAAKNPDRDAKDFGPGYAVQMGWGFAPDRANMLGGWAPGMLPKLLPNGVGQTLPKGADIVVQFHYHRTGKVETDRTKIGLYFAKKPVTQNYRSMPVPGIFGKIPANDPAFKVESSWYTTEDLMLYRLTPHMHMLGQTIELTATAPGAKASTTLVRIPAWDYNWQEQYELKEPMQLAKGTKLSIRAIYDNSANNPYNPFSPPENVRLGEQTTNEMCFVFMGVSTTSTSQRLIRPMR